MKNNTKRNYISLTGMMFMQYMLLAVWWVPLAAYLTNKGIEGSMKSLILSSMAIGSMVSPIIGAFADRYLSAQKVLAISNLLTAIFLAGAGLAQASTMVFVFIFFAMLFYMPTWSLTSTISMTHIKPELFPRVRMFGSIGWVASGVFSFVAILIFKVELFDGSNLPFLCGSAIALIASVFNLFLPDTPASKNKEKLKIGDLLGFKAFSMLRDRNYAIFILCSFFALLAFALYYSFGSEFLQDRQFKYITVTMNWGQVAELFFLFFATTIMARLGIKWVLIIGLIALVARYFSFYLGIALDESIFYIIGILFHGLIFGLFFVGGQVYTDKKAPQHLRGQAQGMLAFILWGVALLFGNFLCGWLIKTNTTTAGTGELLYNWNHTFAITTIFSVVVLILFILFFKQDPEKKKHDM